MRPEGDERGVELAERHGTEDGPLDRSPVALEKLDDSEEDCQGECETCMGHGYVHCDPNVRVAGY